MRCEVVERDRHGRLVAKVFSPNGEGHALLFVAWNIEKTGSGQQPPARLGAGRFAPAPVCFARRRAAA